MNARDLLLVMSDSACWIYKWKTQLGAPTGIHGTEVVDETVLDESFESTAVTTTDRRSLLGAQLRKYCKVKEKAPLLQFGGPITKLLGAGEGRPVRVRFTQ